FFDYERLEVRQVDALTVEPVGDVPEDELIHVVRDAADGAIAEQHVHAGRVSGAEAEALVPLVVAVSISVLGVLPDEIALWLDGPDADNVWIPAAQPTLVIHPIPAQVPIGPQPLFAHQRRVRRTVHDRGERDLHVPDLHGPPVHVHFATFDDAAMVKTL